MTPDRAAGIFLQLMHAPPGELEQVAAQNGLTGGPDPAALLRVQELLLALALALDSGPGPNWANVAAAYGGLQTSRSQNQQAPRPAPLRSSGPPLPSLGDPAPGTTSHQQLQERQQAQVLSQQQAAEQAALRAQQQAVQQAHAAQQLELQRRAAETVHNSVSFYAAMCARCAVDPKRGAITETEFGVPDKEARGALDDDWQDRFDDDAELLQQWQQLFAQYSAQLRQS